MAGATTTFPLDSVAAGNASSPGAVDLGEGGHLYNRVIDFLLLGGATLFVFPALLLLPTAQYGASIGFITLLLANVINHPHFAHSYQIFYRGFGRKLRNSDLGPAMRARYAVAGIAVPILLIGYFGYGVFSGNLQLVAMGGNLMALFVGWHYVKQGYGMLMVDAVLKRRFFSDIEKKILLVNAYMVWGTSWLFLNQAYNQRHLWGLKYFTFAVPAWLLAIAGLAVATSSLVTLHMLWKRNHMGRKAPLTGLMAYGVTLYLWVLFGALNPLWLLVIPALHSLQYLAVVYRFQTNYEVARAKSGDGFGAALFSHRVQLTIFAVLGFAIGAALFWLLPNWLDARFSYEKDIFGPTLFLFLFWIFVNVHHYFLDSVIWRRENPETKLHLFS